MPKKKVILASITTILVLGIGISISQSIMTQQKYENVFYLDATFHQSQKQVEIKFSDNTSQTTGVVLEILGMETSFQRTFNGNSFTLMVPFDGEPQYGWKVVPITLVVSHPEFGKVGLKTDIHSEGQSSKVIFTQL
ncbi:hypothetical protein [Candidatus Nitrosotenuis cloacae]|uniref:Uncharacterized protein n=1 Tax=Candidatus Nitrosotenuis cloacae TaxID=1603555 RepID=A0A3G1B0S7_9ARCH|nr:hypothetical protein [Candidatus Nitrosotenuis cloacae]AJZ75242.1 hypothetical protein SU86_001280 [Candidatus Nitrosotenuis cloacae]